MTSRVRRQAFLAFVAMGTTSLLGAFVVPNPPKDTQRRIDLEAVIPKQFGAWQLDSLSAVFVRPAAELPEYGYVQLLERTYIDPLGRRVMLSIAHGGDQIAGLELHLPEICYRYSGFTVRSRHVAEMHAAAGGAPVTRLAADLPQRPEVVTYWIVLGSERIADANTFRLRRLANAVRRKSADGLLVRVSSLDLNADRAYKLHEGFIADMLQSMQSSDRERIVGTSLVQAHPAGSAGARK